MFASCKEVKQMYMKNGNKKVKIEGTNKYNYYLKLIEMCDSITKADALAEEIANDEELTNTEYVDLYNKTLAKIQKWQAQ
jgi:hypothetical protein